MKTNNRFAYCHCLILMMTPLSKTVVYVCLLSIISISLAKSGDATDPPFTNIAEELNEAIATCPGDPYGESCGNKGIIWRTPDGIVSTTVVPSSLITNELKAPTLNYPCGDPFCFYSYYNPVLGVVMKNKYASFFYLHIYYYCSAQLTKVSIWKQTHVCYMPLLFWFHHHD